MYNNSNRNSNSYHRRHRLCCNVFGEAYDAILSVRKEIGVYVAGAMLACGWWCFLDALIQSSREDAISMGIEDWFSGIVTTIGMIIVHSVNKTDVFGDSDGIVSTHNAFSAKFFLFTGFALMAGGLVGSGCTLVFKYILYFESRDIYFGIAGVVQSTLTILSAIVLWIALSVRKFSYQI
ncbi:hypothetical protein BDF14DRAFT_1791929 [Spinellus fusiger]|nr:hypothetical protein BDF14DRAFT_1791929 [Spinellus fusiger]